MIVDSPFYEVSEKKIMQFDFFKHDFIKMTKKYCNRHIKLWIIVAARGDH